MVIIITAYASVESAIEAMKIGAFDYVQKPFKHEELLLTIERALEHKTLREENVRLRDELKRKFSFGNIIGRSKVMEQVFDLIRAAAPTRSTILVQGESGTGKELVARAIHQNSNRAGFPFIVVNSGSLPPDLLESHLFGHVKGAFTGAVAEKQGLFEAADKGTIFFDEISSVGLETQAKLLRVMQDREFMRLGGTKTIRVDVRIIAATNTDLEELIRQQGLPQGPLLPAERHQDRAPSAARPEGGHPAPGQAFPRPLRPGERQGDRRRLRGRPRDPGAPRLAGERPRARKPDRAGRRLRQDPDHHPGEPARVLPRPGATAAAGPDGIRADGLDLARTDARLPEEADRNDAPRAKGIQKNRGPDARA